MTDPPSRLEVAVVDVDGVGIEVLLFSPAVANGAAVVLLHGWGGSAASMEEPARTLCDLGYLAVCASMRGFGGSGGSDDCGLRQPDDIAAVVAWLRAQRPGEARRVGVLGISQGGQVGLLCAARHRSFDAVAAWAPVTDVASWRETTRYPGIPEYIDAVCADGALGQRSPLHVAASIDAPVLLVHGDADWRVPTDQSRLLHEAIVDAGGDARLVLLPGVEHRRGPDGNKVAMDATADFFAVQLGQRADDASVRRSEGPG